MRNWEWHEFLKKRYFFLIVFGISGVILFRCAKNSKNPFDAHNICFERDQPGATDRHVTFQPVQCSNPDIALGESIGAEFATLTFKDVDDDGISEYIISSEYWCKYGFEPCVYPTRTTVKVQLTEPPMFEVLETVELEELRSLNISEKNIYVKNKIY